MSILSLFAAGLLQPNFPVSSAQKVLPTASGTNQSLGGSQGSYYVAYSDLSRDGLTALAIASSGGGTKTYVFKRTGTTWSLATSWVDTSAYGSVVAYCPIASSTDASTIIIGHGAYNSQAGAAEILTWTGSAYASQQILQAPVPTASSRFGAYVAMSGDGNTVAIPGQTTANGTQVHFFTRSGSTWTLSQSLYITTGGSTTYDTISMSKDGTRCVLGNLREPVSGYSPGAIYILNKSGGTWSVSQRIVANLPSSPATNFGLHCKISPDGSAVCVGAADVVSSSPGRAFLYRYNGSAFVYETEFVYPGSVPSGTSRFGESLALNSDGTLVTVGARFNSTASETGGAWVWAKVNGTWNRIADLYPYSGTGGYAFGTGLCMSEDGKWIMATDPQNSDAGASNGAAFFYPR